MGFTSPIWLWMLLPWGLAVLWILFSRSDYAPVSTTQFWDINHPTQPARRQFRRPPAGFVFLLLAMLATIFAAAGIFWGHSSLGTRFTLVVDRNVGSLTALQKDINAVVDRIQSISGMNAHIDLVTVPDRAVEDVSVAECRVRFGQLKPTAIDTSTTINQVAGSELIRTKQDVFIVSSHPLILTDPRLHRITPNIVLQNAGIDQFVITDRKQPQAMVKVWNNTSVRQAVLQVDEQSQTIDLPIGGGWREFEFDLKKIGTTSVAKLLIEDDIPADNTAYLARRGIWPKLVGQKGLPEGLERMIEVYSRKRPPEAGASKVYIVSQISDAASDAPSLIMSAGTLPPGGKLEITDDKLVRSVNWEQVLKQAKIAPPPTGDWTVLLRVDGQPVIARRDKPIRQVWVGIDNPDWSSRTDFVIFITDLFDYLGESSRGYSAELAHALDRQWTITAESGVLGLESAPGIYRTPEGLVAMNMTVFQPEKDQETTGPEITPQDQKIAYNLTRPMLFATMLFASLGAISLTRTRHRLA